MKSLVFVLLIFLSFQSPCAAKESKRTLSSIDISFDRKSRYDKFPKFRKAQDPFRKFKGKLPSREGLDSINASASGQPIDSEIQFINDQIPPGHKIIFVDLRREKHAYLNGEPILWMGMSVDRITRLLLNAESTTISDREGGVYQVKPITVHTEEELLEKYGIKLVQFRLKHAKEPPPELVDEITRFFEQLDSKTWLHLHCREGYSRTTMAFIMLDMLLNADKVSKEDIITRHRLIGGANMAGDIRLRDQYHFLLNFYEFAKLRKEGRKITWLQFLKTHSKEIDNV